MAKRDERDNRFKVVPKGASERERERDKWWWWQRERPGKRE